MKTKARSNGDTRIEQLGLDAKWVESVRAFNEAMVKDAPIKDDVDKYGRSLRIGLSECHMLMVALYLQGRDEDVRRFFKLLYDRHMEYFAGTWRQTHPDERIRRGDNALWSEEARAAIGWASALGEWERLIAMANVVNADADETAAVNLSVRQFVPLLVRHAAGQRGSYLSMAARELCTRAKTTSTARSFAECVLALIDHGDFKSSFENFSNTYRRSLFTEADLSYKVSLEGTYLFQYATKHGLIASSMETWPGIIRLS